MSRSSLLAVLGLVVALFVGIHAGSVAAGHHRHWHRHHVGTYYSPVHVGYWGAGYRLDYPPYLYDPHPFGLGPVPYPASYGFAHATYGGRPFFQPYTQGAFGHFGHRHFGHSYAGIYGAPFDPMWAGYGAQPYYHPVAVPQPVGAWTTAHYGAFGYSALGCYGW